MPNFASIKLKTKQKVTGDSPLSELMKAIRNMEPACLKVNGRNFALVDYKVTDDSPLSEPET